MMHPVWKPFYQIAQQLALNLYFEISHDRSSAQCVPTCPEHGKLLLGILASYSMIKAVNSHGNLKGI
jgi:hypothetical protein